MIAAVISVLLSSWCCLALAVAAAVSAAAVLAAGELRVRLRRRREDRAWVAEARERIRAAEYLQWLERQFTAMEAGERP